MAAGLAATAFRLGAGVGRLVLLPGRYAAGLPVVRGRAEALAAAGREAETRSRSRLEVAAGGLLTAPETTRTLDRALTETLPDETIEALAHRLLESPAFERVLRDAAQSRLARELVDDAIHSAEMQRMVEEAISAPVRGALASQTAGLWDQVRDRLAAASARADDSLERAARRAFARKQAVEGATLPYAGLASRGVALLTDVAITNLFLLAVGALIGVVGSLLGISLPGVLAAVVAGAGWAVLQAGYFVLFWSTAGQTPGMRIARLHVERPDGDPPSAGRSLVRFAAALVTLAPFGLGLVPVLFDRRRRALHDLVARTAVVRDAVPPVSVP